MSIFAENINVVDSNNVREMGSLFIALLEWFNIPWNLSSNLGVLKQA